MMKPHSSLLVGVAVVLALLVLVLYGAKTIQEKNAVQSESLSDTEVYVSIGTHTFKTEIVVSTEDKARGLGSRDFLCSRCAMLFPFEEHSSHGFWMKNMRFPIDILWIDNGTIVHVEENVSHTDQQTIYQSKKPANAVLEYNAGLSRKYGIEVGSRVIIQ